MKLISIILFCYLATAQAMTKEEAMKEFAVLAKKCMEAVNAGDAALEEVLTHKEASTMESKCIRACMMKTTKVMGDDGVISKEAALELSTAFTEGDPAKTAMAKSMIDTCAAQTADDHCETANIFSECIISEAKKHKVDEGF